MGKQPEAGWLERGEVTQPRLSMRRQHELGERLDKLEQRLCEHEAHVRKAFVIVGLTALAMMLMLGYFTRSHFPWW